MILVVDDKPWEVLPLVEALRLHGSRVELAQGPSDALTAVDRHAREIECVVLDVMMPSDGLYDLRVTGHERYTGLALLSSIRMVLPDVPVLVWSVIGTHDVVRQIREYPHCEVFDKRDTMARVLERVEDILQLRGSGLLNRLTMCPPGWVSYRVYETICVDILRYLFVPPFPEVLEQQRTADGHEVRDAVMPNTLTGGFWGDLKREFGSNHIPCEVKNLSTRITGRHVGQMRLRLKPSLGRFGLVLSRHPPSKSALAECKQAYMNEPRALILLLDDRHVRKMVELKAAGRPAEDVLARLKRDFELGL
jgi:CheY-like chemotaxis protein